MYIMHIPPSCTVFTLIRCRSVNSNSYLCSLLPLGFSIDFSATWISPYKIVVIIIEILDHLIQEKGNHKFEQCTCITFLADMGQAFTEVLEAQLKAFIKELKHKHKHLCF